MSNLSAKGSVPIHLGYSRTHILLRGNESKFEIKHPDLVPCPLEKYNLRARGQMN